jgi:glycosyltransferase involved in cell wall biosynthesis
VTGSCQPAAANPLGEPTLYEPAAWLRSRGPALILGNPQSLFVTQLAAEWQRRGLDVRIVSTGPGLPESTPQSVPVIDSLAYRPGWTRLARSVNVVLRPLERLLPWLLRSRYRRRTGVAKPSKWEVFWVDHYWNSFSCARAAESVNPAFVFAQEAAAYGLAAARCRGTTRVIFPWGGDIYLSCEASPVIAAMMRRSFADVELIVPSSHSARQRIGERFGVATDKVQPISWGVDLQRFRPLSGEHRNAVRRQFGIPEASVVVTNTRRFDPLWGSTRALQASIDIARRHPQVCAVFLAGGYDPAPLNDAKQRVCDLGLDGQFRFFDDVIPLDLFADLIGASDISLSLMTRGDMRSSSVLQAAAAGSIPVIAETPEHRLLQQQGLCCRLVSEDDASLLRSIEELVVRPDLREECARKNRLYLSEHEDQNVQMDRLLTAIADAAQRRDKVPDRHGPLTSSA